MSLTLSQDDAFHEVFPAESEFVFHLTIKGNEYELLWIGLDSDTLMSLTRKTGKIVSQDGFQISNIFISLLF